MGSVFLNVASVSLRFLNRFFVRTERYWIVLLTLYAMLVILLDLARPFITTPANYWSARRYPLATLEAAPRDMP